MRRGFVRVMHICGHHGAYEVSEAVTVEAIEAALAAQPCLSCRTLRKLEEMRENAGADQGLSKEVVSG